MRRLSQRRLRDCRDATGRPDDPCARRRICSPPMSTPAHPEPLNVWDYEALAAERLDAGAYGYFAGGADDELTLRDNVDAFRRWQLRPRVLVDVAEPVDRDDRARPASSRCRCSSRPTAFQRVAHPDGELGDGAGRDGGRDDHVPLDLLDHRAGRRDRDRRGRAGSSSTSARRRGRRASVVAQARDAGLPRARCSPSTRRSSAAASATAAPGSAIPIELAMPAARPAAASTPARAPSS